MQGDNMTRTGALAQHVSDLRDWLHCDQCDQRKEFPYTPLDDNKMHRRLYLDWTAVQVALGSSSPLRAQARVVASLLSSPIKLASQRSYLPRILVLSRTRLISSTFVHCICCICALNPLQEVTAMAVVMILIRPTVSATILTTDNMEVVAQEADEMVAPTAIEMAAGGPKALAAIKMVW